MEGRLKHEDREEGTKKRRDDVSVFVPLCAFFALFVFQPLSHAAELDNLPVSARNALEPVAVDWPHEIERLQDWTKLVPDPVFLTRPDWTGGLPEVSLASLWGTYSVESAKGGKLTADELARVIGEFHWTADDVAAFWDRLDRETADRAREPDVAGQVLTAIEQTPALKDAFGDQASVDALFGLAQVKLFARKLPEARAALEAVLARLPEKTEAGHASRGVAAYRMAQSYEFASDFETAREWYLKCAEWGTPENTGGYDVRSEGYVEAARMCRQLGLDGEAMACYRKAIDECGQWGQAVASMDYAGLLRASGKTEEGRGVLERVAEHGGDAWLATFAFATLAGWAYEDGDAPRVREYCRRGLAQAPGVERSPAQTAKRALTELSERLEGWQNTPIMAQPGQSTTVASPGARVEGHVLKVTTWQAPELTLTCTPPVVEFRLAKTSSERPGETRRDYEPHVLPDCQPGTYRIRVRISGPGLGEAEVPWVAVVHVAP